MGIRKRSDRDARDPDRAVAGRKPVPRGTGFLPVSFAGILKPTLYIRILNRRVPGCWQDLTLCGAPLGPGRPVRFVHRLLESELYNRGIRRNGAHGTEG